MAKPKLLTLNEFAALLPTLHQRLIDGLTKELKDCALPTPKRTCGTCHPWTPRP